MAKKKKTVGAIAADALQKAPDTRDPIEIQRANEQGYIDNLIKCVEDHRSRFLGDFYVIVISKNERLLHNVIRCFFLARSTCPTPDYDQSVYLYRSEQQEIEHIWTIPDKETCLLYIENADSIVPTEYPLLECVLNFKNGFYYNLCKKLNNEQRDDIELVVNS